MLNAYAWFFIAGILLFLGTTVFLVCCTRTGIALPEAAFLDWPVEDDDDQVSALAEDARLSYDRAKGKRKKKKEQRGVNAMLMKRNFFFVCGSVARTTSSR